MKCFIKIDATKELPEVNDKQGLFIVYSEKKEGNTTSYSCNFSAYYYPEGFSYQKQGFKITHWLKEISLSELMIEFAEYSNYAFITKEGREGLLSDLLTEKGYIIKD